MSRTEQNGEGPKPEQGPTPNKKIGRRSARPPGVIGEMKPKKALEILRQMRHTHTLEEDEHTWAQFEPSLRDSKSAHASKEGA